MANELLQQATPVPEPGFWSVLDKIVTDLLTHQIPASFVLLIVAVILGPLAFRHWIKSRKR